MTSPMPSPSRLISFAPESSRGGRDVPAGASQSFLRSSIGTVGSDTGPPKAKPCGSPPSTVRDASPAPLSLPGRSGAPCFSLIKSTAASEPRPADEREAKAARAREVASSSSHCQRRIKIAPSPRQLHKGRKKTRCLMSKSKPGGSHGWRGQEEGAFSRDFRCGSLS